MRDLSVWRTLVLVIVVSLAFSMAGTGNAFARWDDNSGDLPGSDDGVSTGLIVGGVVAAGLIIYVLTRNSGDDKASDAEKASLGDDSSSVELAAIETRVYGISSPALDVETKLPVNPIVCLGKDQAAVGVGFGF